MATHLCLVQQAHAAAMHLGHTQIIHGLQLLNPMRHVPQVVLCTAACSMSTTSTSSSRSARRAQRCLVTSTKCHKEFDKQRHCTAATTTAFSTSSTSSHLDCSRAHIVVSPPTGTICRASTLAALPAKQVHT
eukprot:561883-Amphidinium_carterae.1